jgi:membrane fusion protein (multidrug efflux system)
VLTEEIVTMSMPAWVPVVLRHPSILACTLALVTACGKEPPKPPPAPVDVTTLTVVARDVPVTAEYVAQTQSSQAVNIQARVSGFLDKRVYTEGAEVKAGQILFQMDQKPFQAQVDSQKAALQRSQAGLEVAKANLDRTKPLAAANALSQKDLDDAQGQYEQAAAAVEQGKAQLQEAQLNLSYTTIRSPVDGVSSYAQLADGTYLNPQNSQLTTVSVLTPMWINFSISENEMGRIRNDVRNGLLKFPDGGRFIVEVDLVDGSLFPYKGRITFADPSYNSTTGTFLLRATVDNPAGQLRPNQYVRARLIGAIRPHAIVVPQRALQQSAKGHFLWVINKQNQAELRPVTVGEWQADGWFVTAGLAAGEQVVVDGGVRLAQGATVKATPYVPPKVSPPASSPATADTAQANAAPTTSAVVYFARGDSSLDEAAIKTIRSTAAAMMGIGTVVTITGYADRTGTRSANLDLAKLRAVAVRNALVGAGIQAERIRYKPPIEVTGGGSEDKARRVDITMVR